MNEKPSFFSELKRRNVYKLKLDPLLDPPNFSNLVEKPSRKINKLAGLGCYRLHQFFDEKIHRVADCNSYHSIQAVLGATHDEGNQQQTGPKKHDCWKHRIAAGSERSRKVGLSPTQNKYRAERRYIYEDSQEGGKSE